ncbi:nuclear transport factor 2 family protein [Streptomyces laurentii]|uniref:nuclear transport factor 2 family protein n=1 Tax=Streptomyces laurentii TaxID=39478 RepID=UPI00368938E9
MKIRIASVLIAAAVTAGAATTAVAAQPSKHHEPKKPEIVAAWAAAWSGTDPAALGALFTPNATYTDQGIGVTMTGRDQISGWKARTDAGIENVKITVKQAWRSGDHITVEGVYAGHIKGAPKSFAVPVVTLLDTHGRKITSDQDFYSLNAVFAQSGLPADWTPSAG